MTEIRPYVTTVIFHPIHPPVYKRQSINLSIPRSRSVSALLSYPFRIILGDFRVRVRVRVGVGDGVWCVTVS